MDVSYSASGRTGLLRYVGIGRGYNLWRVPLGRYAILDSLGIDQNTGVENFGGLAVTAGGFVIIAATEDGMFRAFSAADGDVLWEFKLEASGHSSPAIYEIDGKQYVVQVAGGGGRKACSPLSPGLGRTVYAFTLPADIGMN